MDNYVFISYSSQDRQIGEQVCAALESRDIKCWIAPRDILPGAEWVEATVDALDGSSVVVLVLSASSNSSPQVIREIGRAASKDIPIIPFRIDDTPLSRSMEFFISSHHWLDAQEPPLDKHFQRLADTVQKLLAQTMAAKSEKEAAEAAKEQAKKEEEAAQERARQEAEEARKAQEAAIKAKEEAEAAQERARQEAEEARKAQEAAIKAKEEAEAAAREQAMREAEAAQERAKQEAEEARKAQEAVRKAREETEAARERAKQEAEEARKALDAAIKAKEEAEAARERARQEAIKSTEAAVGEKPAPAVKKTGEPGWLWAGIILTLGGLGITWSFTIIWSTGLLGSTKPAQDAWYELFTLLLMFGLPGLILGVYPLRRGIAGYLPDKPADGRVSNWWWLLIVLGVIGGIISWVKHKNINWRQARNMLTVGIFLTFLFTMPVLAASEGCHRYIINYSENFEEGKVECWSLDPGWQVVRDGGNYVLEGQGQEFQSARPSVTSAENYVLEADFEILSGQFEFEVRVVTPGSFYVVFIAQNNVDLGKQIGNEFLRFARSETDIGFGQWHTIGIALDGSNIKVYIDDKLKIDYWDEEPLQAGGFLIKSHPNSHVRVDNINVMPPPEAEPPPEPEPAPPPEPEPEPPPPEPEPDITAPKPKPPPEPEPEMAAPESEYYFSGYIRESGTDTPIKGASVTVFSYNPPDFILNWHAGATTDDAGYYKTAPAVSSGSYVLKVTASGYFTEWFDNAYSQEEAMPILMAAPGEVKEYNITLERMGSISGRVISEDSLEGIANVNVCAEDYFTHQWMSGANTGEDGGYTIRDLPAGSYRVRAMPSVSFLPYADEYYDDTYRHHEAQAVTVATSQGTAGINFSLAAGGGSISGVVRNADGSAPLADVSVDCFRIVDGVWESWGTATNSFGQYRIRGMPHGDFGVRAPGGGRWGAGDNEFVQEYFNEKSSSGQASQVTVAEGINPTDINFTLSTGGSISGRVVAEDILEGIANLHLYATDYSTNEWMSCAYTGEDGTYTIHGLPAGAYRVFAMPSNENLPYVDEYYEDTTSYNAARRVNVTVGQNTPGINFLLQRLR